MTEPIIVTIPRSEEAETYTIEIGRGTMATLGASLRAVPAIAKADRILVIGDEQTGLLFLPAVRESLVDAGFDVCNMSIPAGERAKSIAVLEAIWNMMVLRHLTRESAVIAVGGGAVGDVAGFAAATYMRGIPFVQVPTTLLAMVDASVGGKTAIDLAAGKNLVGAFWQPSFVCLDIAALETLGFRDRASGLAEIAKTSLVSTEPFARELLANAEPLASWASMEGASECTGQDTQSALLWAISSSVRAKQAIVEADPLDTCGLRARLNYGHTLGHALEKTSGYRLPHGLAVAEGMRFALFVAQEQGVDCAETVQIQGELLDVLGLPPMLWTTLLEGDADSFGRYVGALVSAMENDKKATADAISFIVPDGADWTSIQVDADTLTRLVTSWLER